MARCIIFAALCACVAAAASRSNALSCTDRCVNAGHCCTGNGSSCARPSCQMGCNFGTGSPSFDACNATCFAAGAAGCSFKFQGQTYGMCGDCSQRWLDPSTLTPEILPGAEPYWPPGFALPSCTSCDSIEDECVLGCSLAFNPGLNPTPPSPTPPPPAPLPPAPWPNPSAGFNFSVTQTSHMVLQQAPAAAAVYGNVGVGGDGAQVTVTVLPSSGAPYIVNASVAGGRWKALLQPTPSTQPALTYTITAACVAGCNGTAALLDVVFGDVWYCAGQSNMWLQLQYTYARNASWAAIAAGAYDNLRVASGDSQSQGLAPVFPPTHPWRPVREAAALDAHDADALDQFSAPCFHFAEALTDQFRAAGRAPPTLGLVGAAIGGSMIEEWVTNEVAAGCYGASPDANGGGLNHVLWDVNVRPYLDMTLKGWLFYQGENNAGSLHGNSQARAGYGCLMPALIAAWRAAWSATPGTTDPAAPFGLVSLSADDSEGASDMGSFRWAQTGGYGAVPNVAMPGPSFLAHAYDLADPWVDCGDAPQTKQCPGCDTADAAASCLTPFYMGPSIHPRLKKPVGQRLAAAALAAVYGWGGPVTGPTLAGCSVDGATLTLRFNATLLAGAPLAVAAYDSAFPNRSGLSVLVNSTGAPATGVWVPLNVALAAAAPAALEVDLSPLGGASPQAVKYAWGATGGAPNDRDVVCCASPLGASSGECEPGKCPVTAAVATAPYGGLPANPFLAQVTAGGKCVCPAPQVCDA